MKIGDLVKHKHGVWPSTPAAVFVGIVTEICEEPAFSGDQKIVVFWLQTGNYTTGGTKYLEAL